MTMGLRRKDFWKKNRNTVLIGGGLLAALIVVAVIAFAGVTNPPPPPSTEFDVIAWDGGRGIELPAGSFTFTLYGVEGTNLNDFGMFDQLDTGTSLGDISKSDLDTDYDQWVVKVSGDVEADWWDVDEPKVDEIDTTYDHLYYERWFVLNKEAINYLVFYEEASTHDFVIIKQDTFLATTCPIVSKTNVTIVAGTNKSQPYARFVTGPNYANEELDQPYFIVKCNETVSLNELIMSGTTKSRISDTEIKFTFGVLSNIPAYFDLNFGDDVVAGDFSITDIDMYFGETLLAAH